MSRSMMQRALMKEAGVDEGLVDMAMVMALGCNKCPAEAGRETATNLT